VCEEDAAYQKYREQRGWSIEPLLEASQRGWFRHKNVNCYVTGKKMKKY